LNLALSEAPGPVSFLIQRGVTGGQHSLLPRAEAPDFETITVEATSLDAFFGDACRSCCMWMDVEGASGNVLLGAKQTLKAVQAMLIEVEDRAVWEKANGCGPRSSSSCCLMA
jgi:FkbM family methyltransferase